MVLVIPPPVTVTVPVLVFVAVFAATLSVSWLLFIPLVGETVSQEVSLLVAVHKVFEVTVTVVVSADVDGSQAVGDTVSDAAAEDSCVTVTVLVIPLPVTVTVPILADVPAFAKAASMIFPLPVPLAGDTISQDALLVAVQETSDVINTSANTTDGAAVHEVIDNSSVSVTFGIASCVTVIVFAILPTATVTVPVLAVAPLFCVALNVSTPSPVPSAGETVSHCESLLAAVQDELDATVIVVVLPSAKGTHVSSDTVKVASSSGDTTSTDVMLPYVSYVYVTVLPES